jgi:cold shock CspA family protein
LNWRDWLARGILGSFVALVVAVFTLYLPYGNFPWHMDWSMLAKPVLLLLSGIVFYELFLRLLQRYTGLFGKEGTRRRSEGSRGRRSFKSARTGRGKEKRKKISYSEPLKPGKIRWYNHANGYGFISPLEVNEQSGDQKDVFFHWNDIVREGTEEQTLRELRDGSKVEYAAEDSPRGLKALVVKLKAEQ